MVEAATYKVLSGGLIQCRVRIEGTYRGRAWVYVDPPDSDGSQFICPADEFGVRDPSHYWWSEGNLSCDCNRSSFLPPEWEETNELQVSGECGEEIRIDRITPLDPSLPALVLNESSDA